MTSNLDLEQTVGKIWKEVLSVPDGKGEATFFDLNGDSITAVRLVSRIEDEIGVEIEVGDIFEEDPSLAVLVKDVVAKAAAR
ncbi:phosphopantetheine-binding protein [Amycolatopsis magusensis]|uniref:Acyl carrier protein n=1 Tax=Amycolatopsis magusensis TaxID=882444 RepID=A0ABS4PR40_9PSEU|nr:phosphopantetheine-binding protein [Amycolatopsis magusensis]MBP2181076.1 acyl carrier protein [Amycolatopsis magusensis]MDI5980908.1 phosphopantetheine-binding protein [Amycolatopsis magusensis]UJW32995.1 phosphopantetheine-binding protein [Saccharothrix sp. AJ9571]